MNLQKIICYYLALFFAMSIVAASANADVVVVVSARSAITHLNAEQVTRIFLGKADTFPNGGNAVPIDQIAGCSIRDEFYAKIANKSPSQLSAYWTKIIFTGDGYPPRQLGGNLEVRNAVANNPNAIGYIDKGFVDNSVRVVLAP